MDLNTLLANIQSPEQMDALATRLASHGRPPAGMPGQPQQPASPAAPQAPNPMAISAQPPAIPQPTSVGELFGGV